MLALNASIAIDTIRANRLRSILTLIGVTIGVASVVLVMALGRAGQVEIEKSINAMGRDIVIVWPVADAARTSQAFGRGHLSQRDGDVILRSVSGVTSVTAQLRAMGDAVTPSGHIPVKILGVDPGYLQTVAPQVAAGRFMTASELRGSAPQRCPGSESRSEAVSLNQRGRRAGSHLWHTSHRRRRAEKRRRRSGHASDHAAGDRPGADARRGSWQYHADRCVACEVLVDRTGYGFLGLVTGYYPAKRASHLNPIEALRSE